MKKVYSQYVPIILVWLYIVLFFFTNTDYYANSYYTLIVFIDTFLLTLSILYYFSEGSRWGFTAKKSLLTIISLNVLTELSFIIYVPNYFNCYIIIICLYFFSLMIGGYNSYKANK